VDHRSLVPVLRVRDAFHARVVVARLGSEGILAQLRGADGPYPMGIVEVLVLSDELDAARELLLVDEVESAFPDQDGGEPGGAVRTAPPTWTIVVTLAVLVLLALSHTLGAR
jgi:hypothetical protein